MFDRSQDGDATLKTPEFICFAVDADPPKLVPATAERGWMDSTTDRFAYRCIPLSIANASGWEILSPIAFEATWDGGDLKSDVTLSTSGDPRRLGRLAMSHFGHGVLTLNTGYVFRTSPGWALWARGAPNTFKNRIVPLEGVVETDWLPLPLLMNWRFTRVGTVRFAANEPLCFLTPMAHGLLDAVQPVIRDLETDQELKLACEAWRQSRANFNEKLSEREPKTVAEGWQRHYIRGETPSGDRADFHLSKRRLKTPKSE